MPTITELTLPPVTLNALQRVRYFRRQLLTEKDMQDDQNYFREKMRRHNQLLHGWGAVCGLEVSASPSEERPWLVQIGEGSAIGPYGDEISLGRSITLDLSQFGPGAATDPCNPGSLNRPNNNTGQQAFIAIKYAECVAQPVRSAPGNCGCEPEACEYSRICDSFEIQCLSEMPASNVIPPGPSLCDILQGTTLPTCPPNPEDPWVVLAQVTLPDSPTVHVSNTMIDNFVRRQVFSTAVLQDQLIRCCCNRENADLRATVEIRSIARTPDSERLEMAINITNRGPDLAENVAISSTVSSNRPIIEATNFQSSHGSWTSTDFTQNSQESTFTASLGSLENGEVATLNFEVEINGSESHTTINVECSSATRDPSIINNNATAIFVRSSGSIPGGGPTDLTIEL